MVLCAGNGDLIVWIGLCDDHKAPYHPSVVGWVDLDLIPWALTSRDGFVLVVNLDWIIFPVHKTVPFPKYFGLFQEIDDPISLSPITGFDHEYNNLIVSNEHNVAIEPRKLIIKIHLQGN